MTPTERGVAALQRNEAAYVLGKTTEAQFVRWNARIWTALYRMGIDESVIAVRWRP